MRRVNNNLSLKTKHRIAYLTKPSIFSITTRSTRTELSVAIAILDSRKAKFEYLATRCLVKINAQKNGMLHTEEA